MIINVTQYNNFIKALIDNEPLLSKMSVCGEVSNMRLSGEGIFLTLKDAFCQMDCFCYLDKISDKALQQLETGAEVVVEGSTTLYKNGKIGFFVNKLTPLTAKGEQYLKLQELKKKLAELGFFDRERKKTLPKYIFDIGVVTSLNGAVLHDIFNVISRRNRYAKLHLYDVRVQGDNAAGKIAQGIKTLSKENVDVIIIARGGGSKEDLAAFDSEEVAIALRDCDKPTVSAVGHETDFSICDFCADLRAGTPSIAAEMVTDFDVDYDFGKALDRLNTNMYEIVQQKKADFNELLDKIEKNAKLKSERLWNNLVLKMDKSLYFLKNKLDNNKVNADFALKKIKVLSPENVLGSGKAIVVKGKERVFSVNDVNVGDEIEVYLSDGEVKAKISEVKNGF